MKCWRIFRVLLLAHFAVIWKKVMIKDSASPKTRCCTNLEYSKADRMFDKVAEGHVRHMLASFILPVLQIYCWVCHWKNVVNVNICCICDKNLVAYFLLDHPVCAWLPSVNINVCFIASCYILQLWLCFLFRHVVVISGVTWQPDRWGVIGRRCTTCCVWVSHVFAGWRDGCACADEGDVSEQCPTANVSQPQTRKSDWDL